MAEAMNRYYGEKEATVSLPEILDYLSFSTFKQGIQKIKKSDEKKLDAAHQKYLFKNGYLSQVMLNKPYN